MIISVSGFIGSGKDTVADYLVTEHGFRKMSFAESLKVAVSAVFGWDPIMLEGSTKSSREWREKRDEWWSNRLNMEITPRWILQYWGTDVLRNNFHTDIWVASVENKLRQTKDNIVITDCRFANEVDTLKRVGGTTLRISRGPKPEWYDDAVNFNKGPTNIGWSLGKAKLDRLGIHASEYSSIGLEYDHYIENDGTIDDLHKKIKSIVNL